MNQYLETTQLDKHTCGECGILYAAPSDFWAARRGDRRSFWCPNGHGRHFTGPTEVQKLQSQLDRANEQLTAAQQRAATAEKDRRQISAAHQKMRARVMNGVCPCCNRTFQNLMSHMKSEHPDFSEIRSMLTLRTAFGMTQAAVALEAGVDGNHVSLYERGRTVSPRHKRRLDDWLERHNGAAQGVTE